MFQGFCKNFAFAFLFVASTAFAQSEVDCTIGVYSDPGGTIRFLSTPSSGQTFDVYVVLRAETVLDAVAYDLAYSGLEPGVDFAQVAAYYGPDGTGLNFPNAGGDVVGLGECAVGFNGNAVVVAQLVFVKINDHRPTGIVELVPNPTQGESAVVYSDCNGVIHECPETESLLIENTVAGEAESFGAMKQLFGS